MERYFNIAGPCIPGEHYMLPALARLPSLRRLVDRKQYFVIHAPRQTGKTTSLNALVREINVISEDLMLRNFTEAEVCALYSQHTEETGQRFEPDAVAKAFEFTQGQPWLVNALARECVEKIHDFDYTVTITSPDIETAKEAIIRRRPVHLDFLLETRKSPQMAEILQATIEREKAASFEGTRHFKLLLELGIVEASKGVLRFTNPVYAETFLEALSKNSKCPQLFTNENENN